MDERTLLYAEYCFYCGNAEEALRLSEPYMHVADPLFRNKACLICSFANLSMGRLKVAFGVIQSLKKSFDVSPASQTPQSRALRAWTTHMFSVLLRIPDVKADPLEEWLRFLPGGFKLFACYVIASEMCSAGKLQGAHAVSRIAVDLSSEHYPLAELYCRIMDAIILVNQKRVEDAERSFMIAWEIALAEPIAEHYFLLHGIVERCIKEQYPQEFRKITDTALIFAKNWYGLQHLGKDNLVETLSAAEFTVAALYAKDWSAKEIAAHMNYSVRTVYRMISNIYVTLGIGSVAELKAQLAY